MKKYNLQIGKNNKPWLWTNDFSEIYTWGNLSNSKKKKVTEFNIVGGGIHLGINVTKKNINRFKKQCPLKLIKN
tara:strand:+ start:566 stop:787 length:222 start_codon:yes stop_codon:yes gene_type:complete